MSKISLVTGSSRGLGRSAALALARHGHDVVITYQSRQAQANEVVAEVLAAFDDPPADAAEQLDGFVRLLVEQGLLER